MKAAKRKRSAAEWLVILKRLSDWPMCCRRITSNT